MTTGPASGVRVLQRSGLGVPPNPALDPFGALRRKRERNRVPGRQWFSSATYYAGPFDERSGLNGAAEFYRKSNINGKPPQIMLTASETGLGFIPGSQTWAMKLLRGRVGTLWVPYEQLATIELEPATTDRMSFMLPNTAHKLGRAILTTTDSRTATLNGVPVAELSAFLASVGAAFME